MKKNLRIFFVFVLCFFLCSCGAEKSVDQMFLDSFKKGLMNRWDITFADGQVDELVNAEIRELAGYRDSTFEDEHLGVLAAEYIAALDESKEALGYQTVDYSKYYQLWQHAYNRRTVVIEELCNSYSITFPEKYADAVNTVLSAAPAAKIQLGIEDAVEAVLETAEVSLSDGSKTYKKYSVIVQNQSGYDIPNLRLQLELYNKNGAIVDTCYCEGVKELKSGQSAILSFSTEMEFDSYTIYATYHS